MSLDKSRLLAFLAIIDRELHRKITLCAAGGTAMTLLDVKPSTLDIDFTILSSDKVLFERALAATPHGFKNDTWPDGLVFCNQLPLDYLSRSSLIKTFEHITLKALHPVDIIVTKVGRLDKRDVDDIVACIEKFSINKLQVKRRAASVEYTGNTAVYSSNLERARDWPSCS